MENSLYVDFINSHTDEIVDYVNEKFDLLKDDFRDKTINKKIKEEFSCFR